MAELEVVTTRCTISSMRTACYARFSSDLQRETSLDDQIRSCREYAERHAWIWQPDQIFTDAAISGASIDGRAGVHALLLAAASQPRPFDVLLVDDSSRMARDLADALRVLQRLKFAGVRVIYISQAIDSASEQAETLVAVHGLVDGLYLREMAQKIRRGLIGQLERGFSTGGLHYGYRSVPLFDPIGARGPDGHPVRIGTQLEIHHAEAALVQRIFELYTGGMGVPTILKTLQQDPAVGRPWRKGAIRRILQNERYCGRQLFGQRRAERVPGTRRKVQRLRPRAEWRIVERPDLRIISDELWNAAEARRQRIARETMRQVGSSRNRGKNAALYSRHLFAGLLTCGVCGGSIVIVTGGHGSPRYGCFQHHTNGTACTNRLTIRAHIADAGLLAGLQAELLKPATVRTIAERLTKALNAIRDRRPAQRADLARIKAEAEVKLHHLVTAIEAGAGAEDLYQAITARRAEIGALDRQLAALDTPLESRIAVIPTWVRQQLTDTAAVLSRAPQRAKAEFQRLEVRFTLTPVREPGQRPFFRAEGRGHFAQLALREYSAISITNRSDPEPDRNQTFSIDLPANHRGPRWRTA